MVSQHHLTKPHDPRETSWVKESRRSHPTEGQNWQGSTTPRLAIGVDAARLSRSVMAWVPVPAWTEHRPWPGPHAGGLCSLVEPPAGTVPKAFGMMWEPGGSILPATRFGIVRICGRSTLHGHQAFFAAVFLDSTELPS